MARLYLVGLVTLIALGVLVWFLKRRKRRDTDADQPFTGNVDPHNIPTANHHTRLATDDWETEARALARNGRKIEAIKLVREHTGLDLKSAKDYVERWN